ncbi:hypothetical protein AC628_00050 [Bradyrhizobium sp. NAS96.2]|nr:hypothetical protein AC628_00050 [Bradyrhizobium sp. NAS96.2]
MVKHGKQLRMMADRAMFLQTAAGRFRLRFCGKLRSDGIAEALVKTFERAESPINPLHYE